MDASVIGAIVSAVAMIIVAVIQGKNLSLQKRQKELAERAEKRAEQRAMESQLSMQLSSANCKLTKVVAKKVMNMKVNGDVKDAMDSMENAQSEYYEFINETAAKGLSKG